MRSFLEIAQYYRPPTMEESMAGVDTYQEPQVDNLAGVNTYQISSTATY